MRHNSHQSYCGLKDDVPIGLGYLAISFTFGIMAREADLTTLRSVVMFFTNLTSAGQFATLGIAQAGAPFMKIVIAQLIISLHYCLMSCFPFQKLNADMPFFHRFFMSYRVTGGILGVSVCRPSCLSSFYSYGPICAAVPGWILDTLLRAVSGELLPTCLLSALNMMLYGIFLAVVIPSAKTSRILVGVILASMALSLMFAHVPFLVGLSSGFKTILLTILVADAATILFPIKEDNEHES